jgi:hypothetical protein
MQSGDYVQLGLTGYNRTLATVASQESGAVETTASDRFAFQSASKALAVTGETQSQPINKEL